MEDVRNMAKGTFSISEFAIPMRTVTVGTDLSNSVDYRAVERLSRPSLTAVPGQFKVLSSA